MTAHLRTGSQHPALSCGGDLLPASLGAPSVRYTDPHEPAALMGAWTRDSGDAWSCDDGVLRLRVAVAGRVSRVDAAASSAAASPEAASHSALAATAHDDGRAACTLGLSATVLRPARLGECQIVIVAPCEVAPRLVDRTLSWRSLHGDATLGASSPLALRWRAPDGRGFEIRSLRGAQACRAAWRDGKLTLAVYLDAAALHPRWSFTGRKTVSLAAPPRDAGERFDVSLALRELREPWDTAPVLAAPLPRGAESALVITDHCDFDTSDRLHAFLHGDERHRGWLDRGLHLTKGVFTLTSTVHGRERAPTLQDATYRALVCRLHVDGSEIAPHGVNESGNLPPADFRDALAEIARDFAPRTWIDHGLTLDYCYTMGGAEHPEYRLLDAVRTHGISTLWSYHDAPNDAAASLNTAAPLVGSRPVRSARALRHLAGGRALVAAHYTRSALRARLSGPVGDAVGRGLSALRGAYMGGGRPMGARARHAVREVTGALRAIARAGRLDTVRTEPYSESDLLSLAPVVYAERGVPLSQTRADDLLLFATTEVLHTRDAYTPEAIARLVEARGVHVGHTYLLNRLPYIAGLFAEGGADRLGDEWEEFVDALERAVAAGSVWNPPVSDLAEWLRGMQHVETMPLVRGGAIVHNRSGEVMRDFTLLLPGDTHVGNVLWGDDAPAGSRRWRDWLAVWNDVTPGPPTRISWT